MFKSINNKLCVFVKYIYSHVAGTVYCYTYRNIFS